MCSMNSAGRCRARWQPNNGLPHRPRRRLKRGSHACKSGSTTTTTSLYSVARASSKGAASLEQAVLAVKAACQEHRRLAEQRETVTQSIRAIGHAYHFVDLERGVRRNGKLIAGDIQQHIETIRTIAQQEHLSETCMDRIEKAARVVPKMQAPIEFVSGYVRRQVKQLALTPPQSFAMQAHLMPSYYLDRVASTRTGKEGASLRALAERLRTPLFTPDGTLGR